MRSHLSLGGGAEGNDSADTRVELVRDALDDTALSGSVATFEEHNHTKPLGLDPRLELHELDLGKGGEGKNIGKP